MIKFRWKSRKDGRRLTVLRVDHTLDDTQLANLLIAASQADVLDWLEYGHGEPDLTKTEIERRIRDKLATNPDAGNWWRDDYPDELEDDAEDWGDRMIAKL